MEGGCGEATAAATAAAEPSAATNMALVGVAGWTGEPDAVPMGPGGCFAGDFASVLAAMAPQSKPG